MNGIQTVGRKLSVGLVVLLVTLALSAQAATYQQDDPARGAKSASFITITKFQAETSDNDQGAFSTLADNGTVVITGTDLNSVPAGDPATVTWTFTLTNATLDAIGGTNDTMTWEMTMEGDSHIEGRNSTLLRNSPDANLSYWCIGPGDTSRMDWYWGGAHEEILRFFPGAVTYSLNGGAPQPGTFRGFTQGECHNMKGTATVGGETTTGGTVLFTNKPPTLIVDTAPGGRFRFINVAFEVSTDVPSPNINLGFLTLSGVSSNQATLGATIITGADVTSYGAGWYEPAGATSTLAVVTNLTIPPSYTFAETVTNLTAGTLYHFRTWASNAAEGLVWSDDEGTFLTEPEQASGIQISAVKSSSMQVSWTPGGASDGSLVIVRHTNPVSAAPVDNITYTADPTYGLGDTPAANEFVVHAGNSNSVVLEGLAGNVDYHVAVFAYATNGMLVNYQQDAPPATNQLTPGGITWETEVQIATAGDGVVLTDEDGELLKAVNFTSAAQSADRVINGVTFTAQTTAEPGWLPPGDKGDFYTDGGVTNEFEGFMDGAMLGDPAGTDETLILTGLTSGRDYVIQLFHSDDRFGSAQNKTVGHAGLGNTAGIRNDPAYAITGALKADGPTATVLLTSGGGRIPLQGYQLRDTTQDTGMLLIVR